MTNRPTATVIFNPSSGWYWDDDHLRQRLHDELSKTYRLTILETRYPGHGTRLAREAARHSDLIIAVGGDGTVGEVATGILGSKASLAIVPSGSTNVIARALGIPVDLMKAIDLLRGPHTTRRIEVAKANDRVLLHMAGCGFDALMFKDANRSLKRAAAWIAYVPAALKNIAGESWAFRISIDGKEIRTKARMVLVANGSFVLDPRFPVGRNIRADDGQVDVIIFAPPNLAAAASVVFWLVMGQLERSRYVRHLRGRQVLIESEPPAPVECDGDVIGTTPLAVQVLPAALPVIVPLNGATPEIAADAGQAPADDAETLVDEVLDEQIESSR